MIIRRQLASYLQNRMKIIILNNRSGHSRCGFKVKDYPFVPKLRLFLSCLDFDLYVYPYFKQVEVSLCRLFHHESSTMSYRERPLLWYNYLGNNKEILL